MLVRRLYAACRVVVVGLVLAASAVTARTSTAQTVTLAEPIVAPAASTKSVLVQIEDWL